MGRACLTFLTLVTRVSFKNFPTSHFCHLGLSFEPSEAAKVRKWEPSKSTKSTKVDQSQETWRNGNAAGFSGQTNGSSNPHRRTFRFQKMDTFGHTLRRLEHQIRQPQPPRRREWVRLLRFHVERIRRLFHIIGVLREDLADLTEDICRQIPVTRDLNAMEELRERARTSLEAAYFHLALRVEAAEDALARMPE